MKKNEIKVGGIYVAKVSDRLVDVRIESAHSRGGWNAVNTATGRRVHIKSAQRLRRPAKAGKTKVTKAEAKEAVAAVVANDAKAAKVAKKATAKPQAKPKGAKKTKTAGAKKEKRLSALDAAAEVLKTSAEPLRCKDIITSMAIQGLWTSPNGKTPEATLYAAITREIGLKCDNARFKKVDRGLFEYNTAAAK